jgi:uncharacterized membrane protein YesL
MASKLPASFRVIGRSVVDWWDAWLDMVMIIIGWFVAQCTIVLGPPATFGMYSVIYEMTNGQSYGVRGLIREGKRFFWKSWQWGALNLLALAILVMNVIFYGEVQTNWAPFVQGIVIMFAILWFCVQFYTLPFFMEQEVKSVWIAMRNGLFTTLASPFFLLPILIVAAIAIVLSVLFIIPLFLGLPALIPFLGFRSLNDRLESYGLREREKTPRELEMEESARVNAPGSGRFTRDSETSAEVTDNKVDIEESK